MGEAGEGRLCLAKQRRGGTGGGGGWVGWGWGWVGWFGGGGVRLTLGGKTLRTA